MRDYRSAACYLEAVTLVEPESSLVLFEDQQAQGIETSCVGLLPGYGEHLCAHSPAAKLGKQRQSADVEAARDLQLLVGLKDGVCRFVCFLLLLYREGKEHADSCPILLGHHAVFVGELAPLPSEAARPDLERRQPRIFWCKPTPHVVGDTARSDAEQVCQLVAVLLARCPEPRQEIGHGYPPRFPR